MLMHLRVAHQLKVTGNRISGTQPIRLQDQRYGIDSSVWARGCSLIRSRFWLPLMTAPKALKMSKYSNLI